MIKATEHQVSFISTLCYTMCMKENLIHYRTSVCNINYHVVWPVKYRRKVLTSEVESYMKELIQQIAKEKGFTVQLFECGECDHVHCFVTAPPKLSVTTIVKYLKGITGRKLLSSFLTCVLNCGKGNSGTIPIIARRSVLYRKKTSAGILNTRANLTERRNVYAAVT